MTIKDLAAQTGYAVGTVSRVLNNHPNVSEKARRAILQAVEESGFQINVNAKQLKQLYRTTVLVVVKGTGNELFSEMLESIQAMMAATNHPLAVDYMDEDSDEVRRAIQLCKEKKPAGLLFLGGNNRNFLNAFAEIDIPCVLVTNDASALPFSNLSSVATDDQAAARSAIEALIQMGHKKIAVIGGDRELSDTSRLRFEGCRQAFAQYGIAFDEEKDYQGVRYSYEGGYQATKTLIADGCRHSAIFAAADVMAIGAIRALGDSGFRVPEDVSVMGYDGLPLGSYLVPQLATVRQSAQVIAQRSVEILLKAIQTGGESQHEMIPYAIQLRESVHAVHE